MGERMSNADSAWFRLDRPENTADVVALLDLDRLPPRERLLSTLAERLRPYRRLRQRAVPSALGGTWEDDPGFSLERHLESVRLAEEGPAALEDLVSRIASEPLDGARPLWRLYAVERPRSGALVAKLSHCMADGFALVGLMLSLADGLPGGALAKYAFPVSRSPWLSARDRSLLALAQPRRALALGRETFALLGAAARMVALPADPPTLLSRPLSGKRRVAFSEGFALPALRAAARERKATVNDLLIAALAGALRARLAPGPGERPVRALVPVNLRPSLAPGDGALGNRFGLVYLELPVAEASPEARLAVVHARTSELKAGADGVAAFLLLEAIGALPVIAPATFRFFARKASLVVTNVPGPAVHLALAGERIARVMFWVPHPATLGLGVSLLSYAGEVRVGVRADLAVMAEPRDLVRAFERELTALGATLVETGASLPAPP